MQATVVRVDTLIQYLRATEVKAHASISEIATRYAAEVKSRFTFAALRSVTGSNVKGGHTYSILPGNEIAACHP